MKLRPIWVFQEIYFSLFCTVIGFQCKRIDFCLCLMAIFSSLPLLDRAKYKPKKVACNCLFIWFSLSLSLLIHIFIPSLFLARSKELAFSFAHEQSRQHKHEILQPFCSSISNNCAFLFLSLSLILSLAKNQHACATVRITMNGRTVTMIYLL